MNYYKQKFINYESSSWKFGISYKTSEFSFEEISRYVCKYIDLNLFTPFKYEDQKIRNDRYPENGDRTWILDGVILALASPLSNQPYVHSESTINKGILTELLIFLLNQLIKRAFKS